MARLGFVLLALLVGFSSLAQARGTVPEPFAPEVSISALPPEARATIRLIDQGGPYPYERDGTEFHNHEKRLPVRSAGYYREYTVRTPGVKGRGARRIVSGSGGELYYTGDHYRTFSRVLTKPASRQQ